ncbi:hypothetical protein B5S33_g5610 [[Candida] boidinii]|nr:hypothetical protein B5S30_g5503 [[Candida] boidinii]OWB86887.1 hypothetical protein B5S33_g5610 [[Candida] boidinii]
MPYSINDSDKIVQLDDDYDISSFNNNNNSSNNNKYKNSKINGTTKNSNSNKFNKNNSNNTNSSPSSLPSSNNNLVDLNKFSDKNSQADKKDSENNKLISDLISNNSNNSNNNNNSISKNSNSSNSFLDLNIDEEINKLASENNKNKASSNNKKIQDNSLDLDLDLDSNAMDFNSNYAQIQSQNQNQNQNQSQARQQQQQQQQQQRQQQLQQGVPQLPQDSLFVPTHSPNYQHQINGINNQQQQQSPYVSTPSTHSLSPLDSPMMMQPNPDGMNTNNNNNNRNSSAGSTPLMQGLSDITTSNILPQNTFHNDTTPIITTPGSANYIGQSPDSGNTPKKNTNGDINLQQYPITDEFSPRILNGGNNSSTDLISTHNNNNNNNNNSNKINNSNNNSNINRQSNRLIPSSQSKIDHSKNLKQNTTNTFKKPKPKKLSSSSASLSTQNQSTNNNSAKSGSSSISSSSLTVASSANSNTNDNSSNNPPKRPAFIMKLWSMVNDHGNAKYISWLPSGDAFQVNDRESFMKFVLPKYFKHNNFASFVRQLNMYGWHKVQDVNSGSLISNDEIWQFQHPFFVKDREDLLDNIVRNKPTKDKDDENEDIDLNSLFNELENMKSKQRLITEDLLRVRQDNEMLWKENFLARERHKAQSETLEKILRFLASLYGGNSAKFLENEGVTNIETLERLQKFSNAYGDPNSQELTNYIPNNNPNNNNNNNYLNHGHQQHYHPYPQNNNNNNRNNQYNDSVNNQQLAQVDHQILNAGGNPYADQQHQMQSSMNPYYSRPMLMIAPNSHNSSITSLPPTPNGGGIPLPHQISTMTPTTPGVIVQQHPSQSGGTPISNDIMDPNAYQQIRQFSRPGSINNTPNPNSGNQNINLPGSIANTPNQIIIGAPGPGNVNAAAPNTNSNISSKIPGTSTNSRFVQGKQNDLNSSISSTVSSVSSASSSNKNGKQKKNSKNSKKSKEYSEPVLQEITRVPESRNDYAVPPIHDQTSYLYQDHHNSNSNNNNNNGLYNNINIGGGSNIDSPRNFLVDLPSNPQTPLIGTPTATATLLNGIENNLKQQSGSLKQVNDWINKLQASKDDVDPNHNTDGASDNNTNTTNNNLNNDFQVEDFFIPDINYQFNYPDSAGVTDNNRFDDFYNVNLDQPQMTGNNEASLSSTPLTETLKSVSASEASTNSNKDLDALLPDGKRSIDEVTGSLPTSHSNKRQK